MCQRCREVLKKGPEPQSVDVVYMCPELGYAGNSKAVDDAEKTRVTQIDKEEPKTGRCFPFSNQGLLPQTVERLTTLAVAYPPNPGVLGEGKVCRISEPTDRTEPTADKNTEESLRLLRWRIYEAIDSMAGDICKTIRIGLQMDVEKLFKEYTNS